MGARLEGTPSALLFSSLLRHHRRIFFGFRVRPDRWVLAHMKPNQTAQLTLIDQLRSRKSYLSTTKVMELLGKSRGTLCGWVRDGVLGAVRIGNENKFDPSVVAQWLADRSI